jgi:beta-lactamase regulating signal transducer with metallopeptidase domain
MSDFLLLLIKVNLAMGAAIVLVSLVRRPLRVQFGAPIAYAIWFLVPIATVASLLPPREVSAPAHVVSVHALSASAPVTGYVPHSAFGAIEQLARNSVIMPSTPMMPLRSWYELFDISWLLFAAWVLGLLLMAAYLTRVQIRFSAAARRGQAGPAVLGFFRPRIVTPTGFREQFTPQEQAAILAHEQVHLARQDARINALAALLRCFCWFNPLIHLGARWLRIDQELACDAITVSGAISRRDYSMALLKSQLMVGVLPFGCNWPGPQHPLVERVALLQRKPPGTARRLAGVSLVLVAAGCAGIGAWAAQPAVARKAPAMSQAGTISALPIIAPSLAATNTQANQLGSDASSTSSSHGTSRQAPHNPAHLVTQERVRAVQIETQIRPDFAVLAQIASLAQPPDIPAQTAIEHTPVQSQEVARNGTGVTADGAAGAPQPIKTEAVLACLLGMGKQGCETIFVGADSVHRAPHSFTPYEAEHLISYCAKEYVRETRDRCPNGPLETIEYFGANTAGADVYVAKFMRAKITYVITPPTSDGKMRWFWTPGGPEYGDAPLQLQSPVLPPRLIYRRPQHF